MRVKVRGQGQGRVNVRGSREGVMVGWSQGGAVGFIRGRFEMKKKCP